MHMVGPLSELLANKSSVSGVSARLIVASHGDRAKPHNANSTCSAMATESNSYFYIMRPSTGRRWAKLCWRTKSNAVRSSFVSWIQQCLLLIALYLCKSLQSWQIPLPGCWVWVLYMGTLSVRLNVYKPIFTSHLFINFCKATENLLIDRQRTDFLRLTDMHISYLR